ncbi:MAG: ornithine carbamoyltransferase [Dehalococcoidia bacterium]
MNTKHLLSITDLTPAETKRIIDYALKLKKSAAPQVLAGKKIALLFEKPSLRTRVSFEIAIQQLGGYCLYLSPAEVGLDKREPVHDVAIVLGRYVDGIIARTFSQQTIQSLADYSGVPVINALSDLEHPCQALADMLTILEKKGSFSNMTLAYIGDGNNVANSLLLAAAQLGVNFRIASPSGYEIEDEMLRSAENFAIAAGSTINTGADPRQAAKDVDVLYTDVWTSMGQEDEAEERRKIFSKYRIDTDILSLAKDDVIFMHPLPAHGGEEVAEGLLTDPRSVVFDQAENRLHAQKALLAELYG